MMSCRAGPPLHAFPHDTHNNSKAFSPLSRPLGRPGFRQMIAESKPPYSSGAESGRLPMRQPPKAVCLGVPCTSPQSDLPPDSKKAMIEVCSNASGLQNQRVSHASGTLVYNLRTLSQRGRLPTGKERLPLELSTGETRWVTYALLQKEEMKTATKTTTTTTERVHLSMLLFANEKDQEPLYRLSLSGADMVANICSEAGPCVHLVTNEGVFEFNCPSTGEYNYRFWESQMRYLGVRIILLSELFLTSGRQILGTGSFAKVFNGQHRATGKAYAIKRVPKNLVSSLPEDHMSAVHIEIDVLRRLNHPFIVQFQTAFEDENMSEDQARATISRVLLALLTLRDNRIVHRDLKLENLVLENSADPTSVKLIDFGLATFLNMPRMSMQCGSPGYVAPEIIYKRVYDARVDVFSAGVILFALLCGKTPFYVDGNRPSQTMLKNKQCNVTFDPKLWHGVSPEAKHLISRMLDRDPQCRISLEDALCHPWLIGYSSVSQLSKKKLVDANNRGEDSVRTTNFTPQNKIAKKSEKAEDDKQHLSILVDHEVSRNRISSFIPHNEFHTTVTRLTLLERSLNPIKDLQREKEAYDEVAKIAGPLLRSLTNLKSPIVINSENSYYTNNCASSGRASTALSAFRTNMSVSTAASSIRASAAWDQSKSTKSVWNTWGSK